MIIHRSLRPPILSFTRQIRFNQQLHPHQLRLNYQIMSVSSAPHPVSSTAEAPKAAEGLEPVTAGASATPAPAPATVKQGKEGKQPKEAKPKKDKSGGAPSGPLELNPPPGYFEERIKIFDEYKAKYDAEIAGELPLLEERSQKLIVSQTPRDHQGCPTQRDRSRRQVLRDHANGRRQGYLAIPR